VWLIHEINSSRIFRSLSTPVGLDDKLDLGSSVFSITTKGVFLLERLMAGSLF
jgi:hypothetical protein